jgi:hypothetical protein
VSRSVVNCKAVIDNGQIIDLEIRQEHPPAAPAAVFWPAPRRVDGTLNLLRAILRMERQRTREVSDA